MLGVEDVTADAAPVTVAFADAQRHDAGLVVVHALHGTGPVRDHVIGHEALARRREAAWTAITDGLAPWRSRYPDVPVEIRIVDAPAHGHLLQAGVAARLIVLGTRARRSATARVVLGSTSHTVLRHAPCPVLVVKRGILADRAGRRGRRGDRRPDPARTRGASRDAGTLDAAGPRPPAAPVSRW